MEKSDEGITSKSKALCQTILDSEQIPPAETLFRDDVFDKTCRKLHYRNEARVIQDITRLIVPFAETLATCGATHLENLIENVNEGWNESIPLVGPRPQPDYSVGFKPSAFTEDQRKRLQPLHRQRHGHVLLCGNLEDVLPVSDLRGQVWRWGA
jgi:hypothetical protein